MRRRVELRFTLIFLLTIASVLSLTAEEKQDQKNRALNPVAAVPRDSIEYDLVGLITDEWIKGEVISLRDGILIFDSDHFDELIIDWTDVRELHTAREVVVVLGNNKTISGYLSMVENHVVIRGEKIEKTRGEIVSIVPLRQSWWAKWDGKLFLGFGASTGNSKQLDFSVVWNNVYRGAFNRYSLLYTGTISRVGSVIIEDNHRATAQWDYFFGERIFLTPVSYMFYQNSFQNILQQHTPTTGLGYKLIYKPAIELELSGGLGYQMNQYESVQIGEPDNSHDMNIFLRTVLDTDITRKIELYIDYFVQFNFLTNTNIYQTLASDLSFEFTRRLDLDLALSWNYIAEPMQREDGSTPEKSDVNFSLGISFDY